MNLGGVAMTILDAQRLLDHWRTTTPSPETRPLTWVMRRMPSGGVRVTLFRGSLSYRANGTHPTDWMKAAETAVLNFTLHTILMRLNGKDFVVRDDGRFVHTRPVIAKVFSGDWTVARGADELGWTRERVEELVKAA
jgi:hypothetical protein